MKFRNLILIMILCFIPIVKINAASLSVSANTSVTVGSNVSVRISGGIGKVGISSSNTSVLSSSTSNLWIEPSGTVTFKAKKVGKATITVRALDLADSNGNEMTGSKTITINVVEKKVYSAVNNLKSLNVDDFELSPKFDPSTTNYNVIVPKGTEKINIKAEIEDSKSNLSGVGEKIVTEGMNKFDIIVTAENGAIKTYTLNVEVEEDPIIVNMNKQDYSVVKQEQAMPQVSSYYALTKINYNYTVAGEEKKYEIPAYYSEVTKYTLLGLKDEKGNINLYIYNSDNNKFTLYNELDFGNIVLYKLDAPKEEVLKGMISSKAKINEREIESYQFNEGSEYFLLYGINVNTGNKGWFMYDSLENTLQRYDIDDISKLIDKNNKFIMVVAFLSVICFLMMLFLLIFINKTTIKPHASAWGSFYINWCL